MAKTQPSDNQTIRDTAAAMIKDRAAATWFRTAGGDANQALDSAKAARRQPNGHGLLRL
jgi:hypothetical protein